MKSGKSKSGAEYVAELKARARKSDPATSHAAASSVKGIRFSQFAVLRALGKIKSGTDLDIADAYEHEYGVIHPQSPSGLRTRRAELVDAGLVVDTGQRKRLPSGRQAVVWARAKGARTRVVARV